MPEVCDLEVASALRTGLLQHELTLNRAAEVLADYFTLPLTRHRHRSLAPESLALWANFTIYDGSYVALAQRLGADFATHDKRLARAVRAHTSLRVLPMGR